MNGITRATVIILTRAERSKLEGLVRSTKTERRLRQRARISDGSGRHGEPSDRACRWLHDRGGIEVARALWRKVDGLDETGDRGGEPKYTAETDKHILAMLDQPMPKGYTRWSGPLLAAALGDVDVQYIWRFQKIDLAGANLGARAAIRSSLPRRPT